MRGRMLVAAKLGLRVLAALPLLTSSGCFYRVYRPAPVVVVQQCRPNQYWDGERCRHNGHGAGARKHDGY